MPIAGAECTRARTFTGGPGGRPCVYIYVEVLMDFSAIYVDTLNVHSTSTQRPQRPQRTPNVHTWNPSRTQRKRWDTPSPMDQRCPDERRHVVNNRRRLVASRPLNETNLHQCGSEIRCGFAYGVLSGIGETGVEELMDNRIEPFDSLECWLNEYRLVIIVTHPVLIETQVLPGEPYVPLSTS